MTSILHRNVGVVGVRRLRRRRALAYDREEVAPEPPGAPASVHMEDEDEEALKSIEDAEEIRE